MDPAHPTELTSGPDPEPTPARVHPLRTTRVLVGLAATAGLAVAIGLLGDLPGLQTAGSGAEFAAIREADRTDLGLANLVDMTFVLVYVWTGWSLALQLRGADGHIRPEARAAALVLSAGGLFDQVENALVRFAFHTDVPSDGLLAAMRAAGWAKWAFAIIGLAMFGRLLLARPRPSLNGAVAVPPELTARPPDDGRPRRGVCLSGGGIRSASFSLGALQALGEDRGGGSYLQHTDHLAAVSGGGYLAAGWAVSSLEAGRLPPSDPPPWSEGSPEEDWFRRHSSYLVPDLTRGLAGAARLVGGVVVNLVLIWLVLFVVARPAGWLMGHLHDELTLDEDDVVRVTDPVGEAALADPRPVEGSGPERYHLDVVSAAVPEAAVCTAEVPGAGSDRDTCASLVPARPVVVEVTDGLVEVVVQPTVGLGVVDDRVVGTDCHTDPLAVRPAGAAPDEARIRWCIEHQPTVAVVDPVFTGGDELIDQLVVTDDPRATALSGFSTAPPLVIDDWMWWTSAVLGVAALTTALGVVLSRATGAWRRTGQVTTRWLGSTAGLVFSLTIAVPWLVHEVPDEPAGLLGGLPGFEDPGATGSGLSGYVVPVGGFLVIALAALRQFLAASRTTLGGESDGVGWVGRMWRRLLGTETKLAWYELSPLKILVAVVGVVVPVVLFLTQVRYAAANGPSGRLMGFAFVRDRLPAWLWLPELVRWVTVVAALGLLARLADAHAWSLHPFYKRRLSGAYLVERVDGEVTDRPYDRPLPFVPLAPEEGSWGGLTRATDDRPSLVLCAAVNLSEPGVVPPGRRAGSFTFSSDHVGGPDVGYVATDAFWAAVPIARRKDLTIPSAMAISGAAFSPAMGKVNLGPIGAALALANLRLGVWLPHPTRFSADAPERRRPAPPDHAAWWRRHRPGWPWLFRELTNTYAWDADHLYVSDGGHWENLGLVELLRRGCTEIVCVNAGGDGRHGFGTISEAIALAREQLGVEIELDPSPLRPARSAETGSGRELRRGDSVEAFSAASHAEGTLRYPDGTEGRLVLIEPALTADLPFDVHGYAEAEPVFPDDSTGDQVFDHRQFEAYRRLGRHQTDQALELSGLTAPSA